LPGVECRIAPFILPVAVSVCLCPYGLAIKICDTLQRAPFNQHYGRICRICIVAGIDISVYPLIYSPRYFAAAGT
jgi:hypothetical protein